MRVIPLAIPEVKVIEPAVFGDERGFFMEVWQTDKLAAAGIDATFVQENHSRSRQGVLRGLHYQIQQPQGKLVRVTSGEVFDVAVDLRRSAPTFGQWVGARLSGENKSLLWVPPGFGHGFYVVSPVADFIYLCTDRWAPQHERVIRWSDPDLAIPWPLIPDAPLSLSERDVNGVDFRDAECYE